MKFTDFPGMTEEEAANFSPRAFEPRLYQDVYAISKHVLAASRIERVEDLVKDQILLRIEKEILTEKIDEQVHRIEEEPYYPSPRHAFLDTLPAGTFRRRFLSYFWGIDPAWEPQRLVHEVVVKRWVNLPEHGVPQQNIEETLAFWA
jgi:hypothetical protein